MKKYYLPIMQLTIFRVGLWSTLHVFITRPPSIPVMVSISKHLFVEPLPRQVRLLQRTKENAQICNVYIDIT